jgi:hypothetical protein
MAKQDLDMVREECKQTMHSVIYHLISAVCLNDSDKWFSLLDVQDPGDPDLEKFLDMTEKVEEILYEIHNNNNNLAAGAMTTSSD